jgi:hypothetical protein
LFLNFSKYGNAALIIIPPSECPMNVSLDNASPGQLSLMKECTSYASLYPMSMIFPSVSSSFADEHINYASGNAIEMQFLNILISNEDP